MATHLSRFDRIKPYLILARLHRPIGIWLTLLPAWWSLTLAAPALDARYVRALMLFLVGATLVRSAGCVLNDLWDRQIDRHVARTRGRPLASGAVTPRAAMVWACGLLLAAFGVLLAFNTPTILLGVGMVLPVALYPLAKRVTFWPQAVLGLTFNGGVLMGWSALWPHVSPWPLVLYAAAVFWTLGYDTLYAVQDRDDDARLGVKSTARLFGDRTPAAVAGFYFVFLGLWAIVAWQYQFSAVFWTFWALAGALLVQQVSLVQRDKGAEAAARAFHQNVWVGMLFFMALLIERVSSSL